MNISAVLKKATPTILTCVGSIGVVATAVFAVRATPKALKQIEEAKTVKMEEKGENLTRMETIAACWTTYTPVALLGIATIGCFFAANLLNKRQQASLISAYAMLDQTYRDYRRSVKNVFGEEGHQRVLEDMMVQKVPSDHVIFTVGAFSSTTLDFNVPEEEHMFYDSYSDRYFTSTIGQVLQAEYHLNRMFAIDGGARLNLFYTYLGIDPIDSGDDVGWWVDYENEFYWVDFNHSLHHIDDGFSEPTECLVIDFPDPPHYPWPD